jgi:hydrogenase-4 component F
MLLVAIVLVPVAGALAAYLDRAPARRAVWLVTGALTHLVLVAAAWRFAPAPAGPGWLAFDPLGGLVLTLVSVVFVAVAAYAVGYLRREDPRGGRAFVSCLLAFLAAASMVALTRHFGLLWVGMEATTLATAPLIYDPRDRRSLEAVWKYLLVCSVGIALALLGTFFLATAQVAGAAPHGGALMLADLVAGARGLHPAWLRAGFVFLLIGFGTKMGLAPMHTWLPDAHGEAPSPISALLSGALLNVAFLAVLRGFEVVQAAGQADFARPLLTGFGLLSLLIAAAFLLGQENYKRMLAYSSIEHMGILAIGVGVSGVAAYGALLHMVGASLAKAMLFLAAGNILVGYGTKRSREITGLLRALPVTGGLFVAGLLAITGAPPFVLFPSEVALLAGAVNGGQVWIAAVMILLQAVAFMAMGSAMLGMALGAPDPELRPAGPREDRWLLAPPLALLMLVLVLGLHIPAGLHRALAAAAGALGGSAP